MARALNKRELQLSIREYQQKLKATVARQTLEVRRIFLGAIDALVFALEAKDHYTAGHSRRVTEIAVAIGDKLGLSADDLERLYDILFQRKG